MPRTLDACLRPALPPLADAHGRRLPGRHDLPARAARASRSSACASAKWTTSGRGAATAAPAALLRRPHGRGADRAAGGMAVRALRARRARRLLYGRGAADMKTGLAAMVTATEEFVQAHPQHRGSHRVPDHQRRGRPLDRWHEARRWKRSSARGERIDWCLVGEPSSEEHGRGHDQDRPARLA